MLGDSLALGTGASDSSRGFAFVTYLAIEAGRPGSEISNYAIGGSVTRDVTRLQVARLRERHVDCAIVCVGSNDVVRGTPAATFAASYDRLLRDVRRTVPHTALVVLGVPDVSLSPLFADHAREVRALASTDNDAARVAARAAGAQFVDLFALTHGRRDPARFLSADRFHPSDEGDRLIASALTPVVNRALDARRRGRSPEAKNQA
ncbi:MAG: SGNH/GDSL hydrolase family protein [Vulcanimicrobiaceae bacterium]